MGNHVFLTESLPEQNCTACFTWLKDYQKHHKVCKECKQQSVTPADILQ